MARGAIIAVGQPTESGGTRIGSPVRVRGAALGGSSPPTRRREEARPASRRLGMGAAEEAPFHHWPDEAAGGPHEHGGSSEGVRPREALHRGGPAANVRSAERASRLAPGRRPRDRASIAWSSAPRRRARMRLELGARCGPPTARSARRRGPCRRLLAQSAARALHSRARARSAILSTGATTPLAFMRPARSWRSANSCATCMYRARAPPRRLHLGGGRRRRSSSRPRRSAVAPASSAEARHGVEPVHRLELVGRAELDLADAGRLEDAAAVARRSTSPSRPR